VADAQGEANLVTSRSAGFLWAAMSSVAIGAIASAANAQTSAPPPPAAANSVEEVIVTAQKRSENIQKTPIAMTAITASRIQSGGITGADKLQFISPSMTFGQNSNYTYVTLRGVGTDLVFLSGEASVATYIDGVYTGDLVSSGLPNLDLQRIEILRGPQGTLYGRNATGGVVNYISKDPSFEPGATVSASYGNYNAVVADADITGAIIPDVVAGRLSLHFNEHDGYRRNLVTGQDEDADRSPSGHAAILIKPNDAFSVILRGDLTHETNSNPHEEISSHSIDGVTGIATPLGIFSLPAASLPANTLSPGDLAKLNGGSIASFLGVGESGQTPPDPTKSLDFLNYFPTLYKTDTGGGSVTVNWAGPVNVKSITAYRFTNFTADADNSGTAAPIIELAPLAQDSRQFTQEFNISGRSFDDRLEWLVGAYYFNDQSTIRVTVPLPNTTEDVILASSLANQTAGSPYSFNLSQPLLTSLFQVASPLATILTDGVDPISGAPLRAGVSVPTTAFLGFAANQSSQSVAGFGQATLHLTDRLRLTAGGRFTDDQKDITRTFHSNLLVLFGETAGLCQDQKNSKTWTAPTGTIGADYDAAKNVLTYAKASWGYKAGGFNSSDCGQPFNPEYLTAYEAGVKSTLVDGQLRLNAATYYYDYTNIQFTYYTNATSPIRNAGKATAYGLELEYQFRPRALPGFSLDGSASYEHSEYGSTLIQDPAFIVPPPGLNIAGNELIRAPKWKSNFGAQYTAPAADYGQLTLRAEAAYTDVIYNDVFNGKAPFASDTTQPAYWIMNAILSWKSRDGRWEGQLFGNNLTNAYYATDRSESNNPAGEVFTTGQFAPPRTFGARLIMRLGSEAH
jgi:iron complex outermembrane recepter protein